MAKVYAPNKHFTGISANVVFKNGVGETSDPHLLKWFNSRGYTVAEIPRSAKANPETKADEVSEKPVREPKLAEEAEPKPAQSKKRQGSKSGGKSGSKPSSRRK